MRTTPQKPIDIETSELRKRVRAAIEKSRRNAAARRTRTDEAGRAYSRLLEETAVPLAQMLANTLRSEGYNFSVFTPSGIVRLGLAKSANDYIEVALDVSQPEPAVVLRVNQTRGSRVLQHERLVRAETPVEGISEEHLLQALLEEIAPFVER